MTPVIIHLQILLFLTLWYLGNCCAEQRNSNNWDNTS